MPKNENKQDLNPAQIAKGVYNHQNETIRVELVHTHIPEPIKDNRIKEKVLTWLAYVLAFAIIAKYIR